MLDQLAQMEGNILENISKLVLERKYQLLKNQLMNKISVNIAEFIMGPPCGKCMDDDQREKYLSMMDIAKDALDKNASLLESDLNKILGI